MHPCIQTDTCENIRCNDDRSFSHSIYVSMCECECECEIMCKIYVSALYDFARFVATKCIKYESHQASFKTIALLLIHIQHKTMGSSMGSSMDATLRVMKGMRYVDPNAYDRIAAMMQKCRIGECEPYISNMARACVYSRNTEKYKQLLAMLEQKIVALNSYNFIIENVPPQAIDVSLNDWVDVGYVNMKDTLSQFGDIDAFELVHGTVYARFSDKARSTTTHAALNNMMIGKNVIHTKVV